jgi:hypothetical protein
MFFKLHDRNTRLLVLVTLAVIGTGYRIVDFVGIPARDRTEGDIVTVVSYGRDGEPGGSDGKYQIARQALPAPTSRTSAATPLLPEAA